MQRSPIQLVIGMILSLGIGVFAILVGMNLLPDSAEASERGVFVPLVLTWGMILGGVLAGIVLAVYLFSVLRARES